MDRTINVILKPLRRFAIQKPNASLLLFAATIVAMVLANSPWADRYHEKENRHKGVVHESQHRHGLAMMRKEVKLPGLQIDWKS